MLTSFEMIDSSLTSEDSQRVPAAHCSHNTRLWEQAPITALLIWMEQVNEGHFNNQQPGIPNCRSGGFFPSFLLPPHFWCTLNWRIFYAHSRLYWSTAITGRVSISGTNSSLSFFRVENHQIHSTYAIHFKIIFAKCPSGLHLNFLDYYLLSMTPNAL